MLRDTSDHLRVELNQGLLRFTGVFAALVGALALLGWFIGSDVLKSVLAGLAPMRPQAAVGFILAGVAFWLLETPGPRARFFVRLNAVIVAALGCGTLVAALFHMRRGVDLLFDQGPSVALATADTTRMATNTAASFVLTAAALFLMSRPQKLARVVLQLAVLGSLVFAFGLMVFTGYLANLAVGMRWWNVTGMALHTSLLFVAIGLSILSVAWQQAGLRWLIGKGLAACFLCGLALFAAVATHSYRSTQEILEATAWIKHTHAVVTGVQQLWAAISESQSAIRGFLMTGNEAFLKPNLAAVIQIHIHFDRIRGLILDNPGQMARLEALQPLIVEWMEGNRERVEARRDTDGPALSKGALEEAGAALHEQIHAGLDAIEKEEYALLAIRETRSTGIIRKAFAVLPVGTLLSLSFLGTGLFLLNREVTRRQASTEALQESERNFRELADAMPQIVWAARPDGFPDYYNRRWVAYTGLSLEQTYAIGWGTVLHPEDLQYCIDTWANACRTGERYNIEYRFKRASDGSYRWHLGRALPVRDAGGKIVRWFGTCTDIEDQKQSEARIRLLNETLEARVKERTAELERAIKELEAFSYSVSHDLRAPLRAIDGYSRMVIEDHGPALGSEGARLLEVIRSESQRMGQLIDDLLSFSRVGRQQMQSTPVDMHGLARSVFADLLAHESSRNVRFELGDLFPARGELSMLRQVWSNLFSNALKFTNQVAEARIEAGCRLEDGEEIFYVRDNGAGFDMRFESKLFGVFQRLHGESQFEGTGVGLALVQRIIHRHGGRVWAEGKVNQGATFYFTVPTVTS